MANWYVRPSGGTYGSENGTSYENAWDGFTNITWGAGGVVADDTLYVNGSFTDEGISVGASGTLGNPITIDCTDATINHSTYNDISIFSRSYINVTGGTFQGSDASTEAGIFLGRAQYINISGCTFNGTRAATVNAIRINIDDTTTQTRNITIENCTFTCIAGYEWRPFYVSHSSADPDFALAYFTFRNNTITNAQGSQFYYGDNATYIANCITGGSRPYGIIIEDNTFTNTVGYAFGIPGTKGTGSDLSAFRRNRIINCGQSAANCNVIQQGNNLDLIIEDNYITNPTTTTGDGHCIIIDWEGDTAYVSERNIVRNNYCSGATSLSTSAGINIYYGKDTECYGNICIGNNWGIETQNSGSTGNKIYNNALIDNVQGGYRNVAISSTNVDFSNNIISGGLVGIDANNDGSALPTESYNCFYNCTTNITDNASASQAIDSTSIEADPLLDTNYKPTKDSPCIEAGTVANQFAKDYNGRPFRKPATIGAYEMTSGFPAQDRTPRT